MNEFVRFDKFATSARIDWSIFNRWEKFHSLRACKWKWFKFIAVNEFFNSNFALSTLFKLLFRLIGSFFIFNKGENNFAENLGESVESNKINEEQKAVDR